MQPAQYISQAEVGVLLLALAVRNFAQPAGSCPCSPFACDPNSPKEGEGSPW